MPGYGVPGEAKGTLPWSWAEERLIACRNYFIASTKPDGRPHVMPIWGSWVDGLFVFSTAITSTKSKNLLANPDCVITVDDGHEAVILEGIAKVVQMDEVPGFAADYKRKYDYKIDDGPKWAVEPRVAFAFIEDDSFAETATKWRWQV